jgi:hypothetical protein
MYESTPFDVNDMRKLVKIYRKHEMEMDFFFFCALMPYYQTEECETYLDQLAGHVIYRLSDSIPKEKREIMHVYPNNEGSLIIDEHKWDSLEDWRKQWEHINPVIPEFVKLLPESEKNRLIL